MESCDVLIVGGGPAGSSLAWGLRHSGQDVIIMDKATFPRNKVCAGWITPTVLDTLQIDINDYKRKNTLQSIHGFRIGRINGKTTDIMYDGAAVSYGIRRCEFDDYLLQRSGARSKTGQAVKSIHAQGRYWVINNQIRTPLLIGAGGYFCPVAAYLGAKTGKSEIAVRAQETEFKMTPEQARESGINAEMPELYFCDDLKGYGWVLRKGDYLNIGLGREDNHGLPGELSSFIHFLRNRKKIPDKIPDRFRGHAYLLNHRASRPLTKKGILLIGDSAGLAYPQSGEGIRPAVESGLLAARIIQTAPGSITQIENEYRQQLEQRFGADRLKTMISNHLPNIFKHFVAQRLLQSHWFLRNILLERWFLHRQQLAMNAD